MGMKFKKGLYRPLNPHKIIGDINKLIYRSSWEQKVMVKFDQSKTILKWGSESFSIPYVSPKDGRKHRYFPDFIIITKGPNDAHRITVIEVKPHAQTKKPRMGGGQKAESTYVRAMIAFAVNTAKWDYAEMYCQKRGWQFVKMTEKEIFSV